MASAREKDAYPGRSGTVESKPKYHRLCQQRLDYAVRRSECQQIVSHNLCIHQVCPTSFPGAKQGVNVGVCQLDLPRGVGISRGFDWMSILYRALL